MPAITIPALEAWEVARRNKAKRWPGPDSGKHRLYPRPVPVISPNFKLKRSDAIYTIGSCFARNIEEELATHGMRLPTLEVVAKPEDEATGRPNGMLNKFVTGSILLELEWALGAREFCSDYLYEVSQGLFMDASLKPGMKPVSLARAMERRGEVTRNTHKVAECDCVTITLGLNESWYDKELGVYLNCSPPLAFIRQHPLRFEFRVLGFEEAYADVNAAIDLIRGVSERSIKVLLTVSPVPLDTTFSPSDVLISNTFSKSVLRAVAGIVAQERSYVDYFPAFEIVTLSDLQFAWGGDFRHVNSKTVAHIVQLLVDHYIVD